MKFMEAAYPTDEAESHPARGAWIEILKKLMTELTALVAPRKGCVD